MVDTPNVTASVVTQIAKGVDGVSEGQVAAILAAWNQARDGESVGTVRRDPTTGKVYVRVDCDGLHQWRVVDPENGASNEFDMESTKPFPLIYTETPDTR